VLAVDPDLSRGLRPVATGEPGRMAVRGPTGLTYWRLPAKQRVDVQLGWSLQDDLIRFDQDGLADYLGRTDFMISTAGHKIAPVEVETALSTHPAVREAVVFGLPDATRRETVAAFVVLNQGFSPSDGLRRELQDYVKSRLAPYKYPRRLDFIDAIPRDSVGKVQPRILKELVLAADSEASLPLAADPEESLPLAADPKLVPAADPKLALAADPETRAGRGPEKS
jgi:2-aminobenzoate-CoA ligase